MITFLDLLKDASFRSYAENRIASEINSTDYMFPHEFPKLFRYRALSSYAIDDIINDRLTLTSIGEFNDLFDGAIHRYGNTEEISDAAEKEWEKLVSLSGGIEHTYISHDDYVKLLADHFHEMSHLHFDQLNYLGTYVCCFSEKNDSTLMWAHYACDNKGISVEYDFNRLCNGSIYRNMLFPIAYSDKPIDISDLLDDENNLICKYPLDTAVLCTGLNKSNVWSYEHEWRLFFVLAMQGENPQRIPMQLDIKPSGIYFGYHFMKSCFYYDNRNQAGYSLAENSIKNLKRLLNYMLQNDITAYYMTPQIGKYELKPTLLNVKKLQLFILKNFDDDIPENIRFYSVILNEFLDMINSTED